MKSAVLFALLLLFCLPEPALAALRCGSDLVTTGDSKLEVQKKCGEPFWRESRGAEEREGVGSGRELRRFIDIDEWIYNFGPRQFLYHLTFENGRLVEIETGDYGFDPDRPDGRDTCREGKLLTTGDTTAEVVVKCGRPDTRDVWVDEVLSRTGPLRERKEFVTVEEWTYNFGPHQFIHLLRFRNGRLVRIERGGYGF